jgi:hypothetical protein
MPMTADGGVAASTRTKAIRAIREVIDGSRV